MDKRKIILITALVVIFIFLLSITKKEDNIRIRVIANSNSYTDLYIKEEIYNIVLSIIDINFTEKDVLNNLDNLKVLLDEYSTKNNISYSLDFGYTDFPMKELNGVISCGGRYKTLLITIGSGQGSNYWTILYPEYYNITFEDIHSGEVEIRFFVLDLLK